MEIKSQEKQKQTMSEEETRAGTGALRTDTRQTYLLLVLVGKHLGR